MFFSMRNFPTNRLKDTSSHEKCNRGRLGLPVRCKTGIISYGGKALTRLRILTTFILTTILIQILTASCSETGTPTVSLPPNTPPPTCTHTPVPSQTPFVPDLATPTPGVLHLWLSPALPNAFRIPLLELKNLDGRPIELVKEVDDGNVRLEPSADVPLSQWVFALVAPFPTLRDGWTMDELLEIWEGNGDENQRLYLPEEHAASIQAIFQSGPSDRVVPSAEDILMDQVWSDSGAIAIIPFGSLEPRWKVLTVNGLSPVHNGFDPTDYPLKVEFGLSGDPESVELVMNTIQWPVSNRDPDRLTVLLMTGVTALTRATAWTMELKGLEYPAEKIKDWLLNADITHISNEVSFFDSCPAPTPDRKGLTFCSDPEYAQLLEAIDVEVIELTGNHIKDYGDESLSMTLEIYDENNWDIFGGGANLDQAYQPLLLEHNGNKLAFLGCNSAGPASVWAKEDSPGATPCDYEQLYPQLRRLKSEGYIPIFTFQWNEYYRAIPTSEQKEDFRAAVDAGALIVSGSQAHQPQAMEFYEGGFIHYGLGNLFFDQMWAIVVRQEFLDRHVFYEGKHISTELLTAFLEDFAQPRPMTTEERGFFLQDIFEASGW